MEKTRLTIKEFLQRSADGVVIDVRSPAEFNHAHIPQSINIPLFNDEERKIVGTAYKQQTREHAIKIGLDFFGPKMRKMVEKVEEEIDNWQSGPGKETTKSVYLYCWRGGMRSAAVAWLLNLYGFRVYTLAGGYKAFRNYVLQTFHERYSLRVLGGFTGSGKTEVLHQLKSTGDKVIDLEAIANHKGSAFGNINMPPQPTQEMFENILSCELRQFATCNEETSTTHSDSQLSILQSPIWIEDESQRIGNLNIPNGFWNTMRSAPIYFLDVPFEERLKHINEEYGNSDKQKLADAIGRISKRLGGLETKNALAFLNEDNIEECFAILLQYYDKRYAKGLATRDNIDTLLRKIECQIVTPENASMLHRQHELISPNG